MNIDDRSTPYTDRLPKKALKLETPADKGPLRREPMADIKYNEGFYCPVSLKISVILLFELQIAQKKSQVKCNQEKKVKNDF